MAEIRLAAFPWERYCTLVQWLSAGPWRRIYRQLEDTNDSHVLSRSRCLSLAERSTATVIVVDDDVSIRRALSSQLQIFGFDVLVFQSAEELLLSKLPADKSCLLLDIYLPGMSGIELSRSLAASGHRLPTILMSGRDDDATRQMMLDAQPIAGLFKPFDQKALLQAIRKALRNLRKNESG